MCGIAGFWDRNYRSQYDLTGTALAMVDTFSWRGPDGKGSFVDDKLGLALAHRRLAIVDLSASGAQPMQVGNFALTYNGEIYNAAEIRNDLTKNGIVFRGNSDTEVLLHACIQYGVVAATKKMLGMFAFAFWDGEAHQLHLVRDRLGKKPMYYGCMNNTLMFASQPKAFLKHKNFSKKISQDALYYYLFYNYVPTPLCIYESFYKLEPGCIVTIDKDLNINKQFYWRLADVLTANIETNSGFNQDILEDLLTDATARRIIADVPVGAFLSGGVDSSLVVALMQKVSKTPVKTFTIGFNDAEFNEAKYAQSIAAHLKTDHHELYVTEQHALDFIDHIPACYDEPFADSSQIPTYLVSKMASEHVKVVLSGDGGDELFAGYNRYFLGNTLWNMSRLIPKLCKIYGLKFLNHLSDSTVQKLSCMLPIVGKFPDKVAKLRRAAVMCNIDSREDFYLQFVKFWGNPQELINHHNPVAINWYNLPAIKNFVAYMQRLDTVTYLPDDILVKVDRASMAVGLEARNPLLDHRVLEYATTIPTSQCYKFNKGKLPLRNILYKYVPESLIERPKVGFGVPLAFWLRNSLKDWAEELLCADKLQDSGINPEPVIKLWQEHLSGAKNNHSLLWVILMWQTWVASN